MRLFKHSTQVAFEVIDLPRTSWHYAGPRRWQVVAIIAVIIVTALTWAVLG